MLEYNNLSDNQYYCLNGKKAQVQQSTPPATTKITEEIYTNGYFFHINSQKQVIGMGTLMMMLIAVGWG